MSNCDDASTKNLKSEVMAQWIESEWLPKHSDQEMLILWISHTCLQQDVLAKFERSLVLDGQFCFVGTAPIECPAVVQTQEYDEEEGTLGFQSGAFLYQFVADKTVNILVMGAHFSDNGWERVALAAIPIDFYPTWLAFAKECNRLASAVPPRMDVVVIGGRQQSFVPTINWEDVILPAKLKADLLDDARSFFSKGTEVYKRLNLKPFRKLLLAGVPGTGKTMICNALAKWALSQSYLVIYVSSAVRNRNQENYGATFNKIAHALSVASRSRRPTLILLEELDAYLHEEEKALVLNILDGSESSINDKGTLLVATTNYPEAIDERVLKRPGRLDRIFVIPETRSHEDAAQMLRRYLGDLWREEHAELVPELIGYPGAFIREVAIYALTQVAYDDLHDLPLALLKQSFKSLKDQIEARDDFLTKRGQQHLGFNGKHHPVPHNGMA